MINNCTLKSNYRRRWWLLTIRGVINQNILSRGLFILKRRLIGCYCGKPVQLQKPNMVQVCTAKMHSEMPGAAICLNFGLLVARFLFLPFLSFLKFTFTFSKHGPYCGGGEMDWCSVQELV